MSLETQTALANEARRIEIKLKLAKLNGLIEAAQSVSTRVAQITSPANIEKTQLLADLEALEIGAGAGITADFGPKSTVTQFIEAERSAAKSACIDYIKANPTCTEQAAADAWNVGAIAAHPAFPYAVQDGLVMGLLYRVNLLQLLLIAENTWEAQRAWIVATDKSIIMAA